MTNPASFIIYSLPRCRTYWLSKFLTSGPWICSHDQLRYLRSLDDAKTWLSQPFVGTVETAAGSWWRLFQQYQPEGRVVVIRRPVEEVVESLVRTGIGFDFQLLRNQLAKMDQKLDQVCQRAENSIVIFYDELAGKASCRDIYEHCLQMPMSENWWEGMNQLNLQSNLIETIRYYSVFKPKLDQLAGVAKRTSLRVIEKNRLKTLSPELVFNQLTLDDFLLKGKRLFAEHADAVGEPADAYLRKNLPVLRAIESLGNLQIITANSNGRMFGYLLSIIGPSLETPDTLSAMHTLFYTSKDSSGLGLKLQRESIERLRSKNVGEVFLRAGVRGTGPRLGTIYRRMGAEEFGQLYKLELESV